MEWAEVKSNFLSIFIVNSNLEIVLLRRVIQKTNTVFQSMYEAKKIDPEKKKFRRYLKGKR